MGAGDARGTSQANRKEAWTTAIAEAYFPLELDYRASERFTGALQRADINGLGVSRLVSDPVSYRRRQRHLQSAVEEDYLITLPRRTSVSFAQLGRDITCAPGGLIIERGDEPYRFSYADRADLLVMKVLRNALERYLVEPDRFCAKTFDASSGAGTLFSSMLSTALSESQALARSGADLVRRQLLELLALTLGGGPAGQTVSAVRAAHLARAKAVIAARFREPGLTPALVADLCGVSLRYLHDVFNDTEDTVAARIRESRLIAARDALSADPSLRISNVAYACGFSDQTHFTRLFRKRFGDSPSSFVKH